MLYRIVQRRFVELDESKDYSEKELKIHRRLHTETSRVVWRGDRDKDFGEKFLRDPKWHANKDWPRTDWNGWVSYSYMLERFEEETQTFQYICFVHPICEVDDPIATYY